MPAGDHRRPTRVDTVTRHVDIDFRPILYAARSSARAPLREQRFRALEFFAVAFVGLCHGRAPFHLLEEGSTASPERIGAHQQRGSGRAQRFRARQEACLVPTRALVSLS
jgi:hypothetical protein